REFGWIVPASTHDGDLVPGPTVTTMVESDTEAGWNKAIEAVQRLLSALAFTYNTRIESRPTAGGSGATDLLAHARARDISDTYGIRLERSPRQVSVPANPRLRLALGLYREGLNAASPFYRFLAFWNTIDAAFDGNEHARDAFLRQSAPHTFRPVSVQ